MSDLGRVLVLAGGLSHERDVSLRSGRRVADALRSVGVEAYQGWLLSRPVPAKDFRELLRLGPLHIPRD